VEVQSTSPTIPLPFLGLMRVKREGGEYSVDAWGMRLSLKMKSDVDEADKVLKWLLSFSVYPGGSSRFLNYSKCGINISAVYFRIWV